jgi:hypothetical protein
MEIRKIWARLGRAKDDRWHVGVHPAGAGEGAGADPQEEQGAHAQASDQLSSLVLCTIMLAKPVWPVG